MDSQRLCQVIKKIISIQDCFDVCMVLEDNCPKIFALSEIVDNLSAKEKKNLDDLFKN